MTYILIVVILGSVPMPMKVATYGYEVDCQKAAETFKEVGLPVRTVCVPSPIDGVIRGN